MEEEESLGAIKGQPGGKRAAQPAPGPTPPDPETPVTKQNTEIAPPPYGRERRANITERDSRHALTPKNDGQGLKRTEEGRGNRESTGWCRRKAVEEDRLWTSWWRGWTAEREREQERWGKKQFEGWVEWTWEEENRRREEWTWDRT